MTDHTPGYNCRIGIRFTADARGRKLAHRWSAKALRWLPMALTDAEMLIATGNADELGADKPRHGSASRAFAP